MLKSTLFATALALAALPTHAQEAAWNTPGAGNPLVPGYFADPTIRKFGDIYYIYATTDGTGPTSQPPQVWASRDFVNWRNYTLNWPVTNLIWAPDVIQEKDGTFSYYYCTSECVLRKGTAPTPVGPWRNALGDDRAVLIGDRFVTNAITLDPHIFRDDDGQQYLYFGTWGIYPGFGCGVAKMDADGRPSNTEKRLIVNTEARNFFEAPWVVKRQGIYYFIYSSGRCEDDTYAVEYATSKNPMGPYEYQGVILKTSADGTVHGPGHNSVLEEDGEYYIVYHRHNNPVHSTGGYNRQTAIDRMEFSADGRILPITPTHEAAMPTHLQKQAEEFMKRNLARTASVTASTTYSDNYRPAYAADDNNGTLWRAANNQGEAWLQLDFGRDIDFNEVLTQFEYATFFYQYRLETSVDGQQWTTYADRTQNREAGSPMIDTGKARARYLRLTITDTQRNGQFPAVWNIRVYNATKTFDPLKLLPQPQYDRTKVLANYPWLTRKDVEQDERQASQKLAHHLLHLSASSYDMAQMVQGIPVVEQEGKAAFRFNGHQRMTIDTVATQTLRYNGAYTVAAWVYNPTIDNLETLVHLTPTTADRNTMELRHGINASEGIVGHSNGFHNIGAPEAIRAATWQHWVVTYDGYMERVYLDGREVAQRDTYLNLTPDGTITLGMNAEGDHAFTGFIHSVDIYDRAMTPTEVNALRQKPSALTDKQQKQLQTVDLWQGHEPQLEAELASPELIRARVADAAETPKGKKKKAAPYGSAPTLPDGLFDYTFQTFHPDEDSDQRTGSPQALLSIAPGTRKALVMATVSPVVGDSAMILTHEVKVPRKAFRNLSAQLLEAASGKGKQITAADGQQLVVLSSKDSHLGEGQADNAPTALTEVTGDFIAQCHLADMTGLSEQRVPAYNEGGLLVSSPDGSSIVQLGAFPHYNCGNMLTVVTPDGRPQWPNATGYQFHRYMQLERRSNTLHARTSADGVHWTDMPHSPVDLPSAIGKTIKVGLYQVTYTTAEASASFDQVKLWQKAE